MKINSSAALVIDDDCLESREATISFNPVIAHVLSRDLYHRPAEAVLREILINALDAHVEAGTTQPVEVHLPSAWDEMFYIRDFGIGMSHKDAMDIYMAYGESTRRDTNDLHGGLGLGTKSPLAYTDAFAVTSWHGDTCSEYLIYYNDSGKPVITLREQYPRGNEPTGLRVQFTMRDSTDWIRFEDAAKAVLPHIPRELYTLLDSTLDEYQLETPKQSVYGPIYLTPGAGIAVAMGYVRYEVNLEEVLRYIKTSGTMFNLGTGNNTAQFEVATVIEKLASTQCIGITGGIGDFQVHPSRESIIVSRKTATAIGKVVAEGVQCMLSASSTPDVKRDVNISGMIGNVSPAITDLKVRARLLKRGRYSWQMGDVGRQLNSYKELIDELKSDDMLKSINSALLALSSVSPDDMTDYLGSGRKGASYIFPGNLNNNTSLLVVDYDTTDDGVLEALSRELWEFSLGGEVEKWRREQKESAELQNKPWQMRHPREVVRSMQSPTHNVLLYDYSTLPVQTPPWAKPRPSYGTKKTHWISAKHNVETLKELGRPVFWTPTKMGCAVEKHDLDRFVAAINCLDRLIDPSEKPIIVGLPASKGTKKIEAVFRPLARLEPWLIQFINRSSVQRRLKLAKTAQELTSYMPGWGAKTVGYGPAERLYRLYQACKHVTKISTTTKRVIIPENLKFVEDIRPVSGLPIKPLVNHVKLVFPVTFRVPRYEPVEKELLDWSTKLGKALGKKPTGAKYK